MKIGVDIRTLCFRRGGISQYTYNLLKNLVRIDSENSYYLFNYNRSPYEWNNFNNNVREIVLRLPQRYSMKTLWENILVPAAAKILGINLWFGPDFTIPRSLRIPSVVTVHDLIFKKFHSAAKHKALQKLSFRVSHSIRKAHRIIATSLFTGEEVKKEYKVDDSKIVVIHEAANERFHKIEAQSMLTRVLRRHGICFSYILFVGETSERKNLVRLLRAHHVLKKEKKLGDRRLLIVGKRTIDTAKIMEEVHKLDLTSDVLFTGYIPDDDLPFIYNGSDLFVFPSLYEGFGIPPLEAIQCGTPVVASRTTSIPEVVGDGALFFDPYDVEDIAEKIDQIINNKVNVEELKKKGKRQAERFSWEKTARQTLAVFDGLKRDRTDRGRF